MAQDAPSPPATSRLDRWFGLSELGTRPAVELRAGLTTFLTMAYILFVNPAILGEAIVIEGVAVGPQLLTVTALSAAIGTLLMGLFARYPFALAPGMGLNAYFTYSVVLGMGVDWRVALGAVFLSGVIFLLLSFAGVREAIVNAIPTELQLATTAGIGLFLAFIGLNNAGLVASHPQTLVTLGDLSAPGPLLALFGLAVTAILMAAKRRWAILAGIAATALLAILTGAPVFGGEAFGGFTEGVVRAPAWPTDLAFELDLVGALGLGLLDVVFVFFFVDLFDTAGTLMGLSHKAGFVDERGRLPRASRAFASDAVATVVGAVLGTSTTTAYVESAAGVETGGRSGLTAVTVALLFGLSIFLWPLAGAIPPAATAPALIVVGSLMMGTVARISWDEAHIAIPAFLTVIAMPLTFSIANGVAFGLIAWAVLHLASGRAKQVHPVVYGLAVLLVVRYVWLGGG